MQEQSDRHRQQSPERLSRLRNADVLHFLFIHIDEGDGFSRHLSNKSMHYDAAVSCQVAIALAQSNGGTNHGLNRCEA